MLVFWGVALVVSRNNIHTPPSHRTCSDVNFCQKHHCFFNVLASLKLTVTVAPENHGFQSESPFPGFVTVC